MKLLKRTKPKQPKKQVIETYTAAFLDHRSKSYHKIVMTAFVGMFGIMGGLYLFSSNAASPGATQTTNNNSMMYLLAGLIVVALFIAIVLFVKRKK